MLKIPKLGSAKAQMPQHGIYLAESNQFLCWAYSEGVTFTARGTVVASLYFVDHEYKLA